MRPRLSAAALQERRRLAVRMRDAGWSRNQVAHVLEVHPTTVSKWKARTRHGGLKRLQARPHRGAKPKLSRRQARQLRHWLQKDPTWMGFPTSLWTGRRVAALIRRRFGVRYHPCQAWRVLRRLGLSPQKPQTPAWERDSKAVERWRRRRWPRIKKVPARKGGICSCWMKAASCSSRSVVGRGHRAVARPGCGAGTAGTVAA